MIETTSPINDHQRDWDARNDPCAFHELTLSSNRKHRFIIPFAIAILTCPRFDHIKYLPYLVPSRYRSSLVQLVHMILHPHDLVIRCAAYLDEDSPSGPIVSLHHLEVQIPHLDTYFSTHHLLLPDLDLYDHPFMVWRLIQSKQPPMTCDRIIVSRSKE